MFYKRNSVTGRLAPASVQTPSKLGAVGESPPISYPPGTKFPKAPTSRISGVPEFLAKKMKIFQTNSGVPIHLKGGPIDRVLFGSTLVLCVVGTAGCFKFFYDMSFPKRAD